jgi:hypothetical protein
MESATFCIGEFVANVIQVLLPHVNVAAACLKDMYRLCVYLLT